jgi:hypothetical protein
MSALHVVVGAQRVKLDDKLLLGQGGEARVFTHPNASDVAIKIFHDATHIGALAKLRERKLRALVQMKRGLPSLAIAPIDVVTSASGANAGEIVGYSMRRVHGARDIAVLAKKAARPIGNDAVLALFRALADSVDVLHERGVIVGDLNDGNVVLDASFAPFLIDVDSTQITTTSGALPCPVAHERFLDPRLYGKSLVDDAVFDAGSDSFALRVLLFQSLLCVHPYGGVHAKFATLLRRAEASWSVLRGDVTMPKAALPIESLPDDMLEDFARVFDGADRSPLKSAKLQASFRTCASCGIEHARSSCPACKTAAPVPSVRSVGGVREESVVDARSGVVLAAVAQRSGAQLAYLVDLSPGVRRPANGEADCVPGDDARGSRVLREDHGVVLTGARPAHIKLSIAGDATWIANGTELVKVRGEQVVDRALTSLSNQGEPMFAAGSAGLFVVEGDALVHHESRVRVGRILEGATTFIASEDGGVGLWFAGCVLRAFRFTADPRDFVDVELPPFAHHAKLVDASASFDERDGRALLGFAHDIDGKRAHSLVLVDARGHLLASGTGFEAMRGCCLAHGRMLAPTSAGVAAIEVRGRELTLGAAIAETRGFVDASCELLPGPGGSLVVVSPGSITKLTTHRSAP